MVTVLQEIIEWSQGRPAWQCDALRRLVLNGELSADDVGALVEICKATHGLAEQQEFAPLTKNHVRDEREDAAPVLA